MPGVPFLFLQMKAFMRLLQYLKNLRCCEEAIDPAIVQAIHHGYNSQETTYNRWPEWKKRFYYSTQGNYPFLFIPWAERFIDYGAKWGVCEVLSNKFSGCYLACYTTILGFYACHIHTGDQDKKHEWNEFAKNNISDANCIIFQPKTEYNLDFLIKPNSNLQLMHGADIHFDTWGVISPNTRECATIYVASSSVFIGSGYNPNYQTGVFKLKYIRSYPLKSRLILNEQNIPY